jgi:HTH-type transcriptional regulator/antitoxin HigA
LRISSICTSSTAKLLEAAPPRVIPSDEQNEAYIDALHQLERRQPKWTSEEAELADLLPLLIEDFEDKHYQLPKSSPLEVLEFLMHLHSLRQKDLTDIFGTPSIISEVIHGRRELNKESTSAA